MSKVERRMGDSATMSRGRAAVLLAALPLFLMVVLLLLAPASPAAAQETVPRIEDAELVFDQAVQAFEEGDFGMAYRRFRLLYDTYALNRKTTAAYLMAGKSLYRAGQYREAADLLTAFIRRFPTSSYIGEAQRTLDFALQQMELVARQRETVDLGVLLPLGGEDTGLTQALFNGIRAAVEEQNASAQGPRVRMVFRDTKGNTQAAAQAVRELAAAGVRAVVGPLYSPEARAAGAAAEQAGLVLIAPLATDEDVSEGRRFVFQANPTITLRGREMAAFAMNTLRLGRFGIAAERDAGGISERMAEGFQESVILQGGRLVFYELFDNARGWAQLDQAVGPDTLADVAALYLPVSGGRADTHIDAVLQSLDRAGANVRVLGNAEWHNYRNKELASRFGTTYTNDFYVDPARPGLRDFQQRFAAIAGNVPDAGSVRSRLAYTGYDLAHFLFDRLTTDAARPLADAIRSAPPYQGLGLRLDFAEGNVNRALYFFQYRNGRSELIR